MITDQKTKWREKGIFARGKLWLANSGHKEKKKKKKKLAQESSPSAGDRGSRKRI